MAPSMKPHHTSEHVITHFPGTLQEYISCHLIEVYGALQSNISQPEVSPAEAARKKAGNQSINNWYPVLPGPIPPPPPKPRVQRKKGLPPTRRSLRGIEDADDAGIDNERELLAGGRPALTAEGRKAAKDKHETKMRKRRWPKMKFSNNYKMKLGWTPFPQYTKPSARDCWQVFRILQKDLKDKGIAVINIDEKAQASGAEGPLHAADGASVNSIVKTILSQATDNELALTQEAILKETFRYSYQGEMVVGKVPNYHAIRRASEADVEAAIRHGGLSTSKSIKIKQVLDIVYNENAQRLAAANEPILDEPQEEPDFVPGMLSLDFLHGMNAQDTLDWLLRLPGVGVKTAYCILQFNLKIPAYAVDTHVMQMAKILGWLPPWASTSLNKACIHLDSRVPDRLKYGLHQVKWHHRQNCSTCGTIKNNSPCPLLARKLVNISRKSERVRPSVSNKILEDDDEKTILIKQKRKAKNDLARERKKQNTTVPAYVPFDNMDEEEAEEQGYVLRTISITDGFGENRQNTTRFKVGWYLSSNTRAMDTTKPATTEQAAAAEDEIAQQVAADPHLKLRQSPLQGFRTTVNEAEGDSTTISDKSTSPTLPDDHDRFAVQFEYHAKSSSDFEDDEMFVGDEDALNEDKNDEGYDGYEDDYYKYDNYGDDAVTKTTTTTTKTMATTMVAVTTETSEDHSAGMEKE